MQIQADFCYLNLQIHHLHEQELEQDERFESMFPDTDTKNVDFCSRLQSEVNFTGCNLFHLPQTTS